MADGTTPNQGFTLPEVGASKDSWGTKNNDNWTDTDTLLKEANSVANGGTFLALAQGGTVEGRLTVSLQNTAPVVVNNTDADDTVGILMQNAGANTMGIGSTNTGTKRLIIANGYHTVAADHMFTINVDTTQATFFPAETYSVIVEPNEIKFTRTDAGASLVSNVNGAVSFAFYDQGTTVNPVALIAPAGTDVDTYGTSTVITREKGDARYVKASAMTLMLSTLVTKGSLTQPEADSISALFGV